MVGGSTVNSDLECCVLLVLWFSDFSSRKSGKTLAEAFWFVF